MRLYDDCANRHADLILNGTLDICTAIFFSFFFFFFHTGDNFCDIFLSIPHYYFLMKRDLLCKGKKLLQKGTNSFLSESTIWEETQTDSERVTSPESVTLHLKMHLLHLRRLCRWWRTRSTEESKEDPCSSSVRFTLWNLKTNIHVHVADDKFSRRQVNYYPVLILLSLLLESKESIHFWIPVVFLFFIAKAPQKRMKRSFHMWYSKLLNGMI